MSEPEQMTLDMQLRYAAELRLDDEIAQEADELSAQELDRLGVEARLAMMRQESASPELTRRERQRYVDWRTERYQTQRRRRETGDFTMYHSWMD
jgi:hypothetical protein